MSFLCKWGSLVKQIVWLNWSRLKHRRFMQIRRADVCADAATCARTWTGWRRVAAEAIPTRRTAAGRRRNSRRWAALRSCRRVRCRRRAAPSRSSRTRPPTWWPLPAPSFRRPESSAADCGIGPTVCRPTLPDRLPDPVHRRAAIRRRPHRRRRRRRPTAPLWAVTWPTSSSNDAPWGRICWNARGKNDLNFMQMSCSFAYAFNHWNFSIDKSRHGSGNCGLFAHRMDFSSFNALPRHKLNSYHIKVSWFD